ncbi:MAG: hypothetical protein WB586_08410 [Chthoniobacterales bacterium]
MIRFFVALVILIFASFLFQRFLPPILLLKGAPILVVPAIFFYGCLAFPFPLVLALTFVTGVLHDLFVVPQVVPHTDFPVGTSILIYLIPGLVMHGTRFLFLRYRWQTHFLLAEIASALTPFLLLAQYAVLSFERRELFFNDVILWRIFGPGLISIVIAPCVFFILTPLSHLLQYRPGLSGDAAA